MLWKIIFIVLLVIQEIQILYYAHLIQKISDLFEIIVMSKIKGIIAVDKDGNKRILSPIHHDDDEDDDAGF